MLKEIKQASTQLKHQLVTQEKLKLRAVRSRSKFLNQSPQNELTARSKDRKTWREDRSFNAINLGYTNEKKEDFNSKVITNKRQRFIKETVMKLANDLSTEEMEVKKLMNELKKLSKKH